MRILPVLALCAFMVGFGTPTRADDESDLRRAFAGYVRAFETRDVNARVFVPNGQVFFLKPQPGQAPDTVAARAFSDIVPRWMSASYPVVRGEIRTIRLVSPTMAYVEARLQLGADDHNDLLVFYKLDGAWRIVAKATEARSEGR